MKTDRFGLSPSRKFGGFKPPCEDEAAALLAYLPVFAAEGYSPLINADDRTRYRNEVDEFFDLLSTQRWIKQFWNYDPVGRAELKLGDLREVGWGLIWCARIERFGIGSWGAVIADGTVVKLLIRLRELLELE